MLVSKSWAIAEETTRRIGRKRDGLRKQFEVNWIRRLFALSLSHLFNSWRSTFRARTPLLYLATTRADFPPTSLVRNLPRSALLILSFFATAAVQISQKVGSDGRSNDEILRRTERKSRSYYRAMWIKMSKISRIRKM